MLPNSFLSLQCTFFATQSPSANAPAARNPSTTTMHGLCTVLRMFESESIRLRKSTPEIHQIPIRHTCTYESTIIWVNIFEKRDAVKWKLISKWPFTKSTSHLGSCGYRCEKLSKRYYCKMRINIKMTLPEKHITHVPGRNTFCIQILHVCKNRF